MVQNESPGAEHSARYKNRAAKEMRHPARTTGAECAIQLENQMEGSRGLALLTVDPNP